MRITPVEKLSLKK